MKKFFLQLFCRVLPVFFLFGATLAQGQEFDSTLAHYGRSFQPEKIYLHFDKASYSAGETIWFKGYFMQGILPADSVKTFYIDWVGTNGEVLWHTAAPVVDAASNGQMKIPDDYAGNLIHVRAYTKWMLNFDTAFLFSRDIPVNSAAAAKQHTAPVQPVSDLQFFPESGDLIAGVGNRIAFKATNQWGLPVQVKGIIQNNNNSQVDSFYTVHNGLGSYFFLPQQGVTYTASWEDETGRQYTTPLPAAQNSGVAMQVAVAGTKRQITLQWSGSVPEALQQVHLLGTMNQQVVFKTAVQPTGARNARRVIPTENLPSGVLVITLFDNNWNAIGERVTFIKNNDYSFPTQLEVQHWGLNKRAKNELVITVPSGLEGANLSVSVTDAAIDRDTSENIISGMLLSSEIKGKVYNAAYYFSNNSDTVAAHLDLVMLTHGWRRFKWEDVVRGKLPTINYPKDTAYLSLSGQLFGVPKSQLSGTESLFLFIKRDSVTTPVMLPINRDGSFNDPGFIFFDTLQVYYQLKSKLFGVPEARFMTSRLPALNYAKVSKNFAKQNPFWDTTGSAYNNYQAAEALRLDEKRLGKLMENVTVKARAKATLEAMDEKYTSGMFSTGNAYQFDLANDPTAQAQLNIFTYLQGKVAGLQITTAGATPQLTWRGATPALFLDEFAVDIDFIKNIPVADIAYVKVLRPPFMGAIGGGSGGAIAIYTRQGDDLKTRPGGLSTNKVMGYTPIKEFYAPNYDSFNPKNEQFDSRTTLYWNPMIITTKGANAIKFSFYNNDVTKSFRVVIEGMSKQGLLTHYEEVLE